MQELDFIVDKLTNSVVNTISGDSFATEVSLLIKSDLSKIKQSLGWNFNWEKETIDIKREVYKLSIVNNSSVIQGLMSISIQPDHIEMNLLENAPFNIGKQKLYEGVAGNLVAFACKISFQRGFDGYVSFIAKSLLIEHYKETLGATHFKGQKMFIETEAARKLVETYFKN